ncbi:NERD domain-containing protein [Pedobacter frigoris]|uniref:NERD domain-containing protein n=1 Tax=Pedobacter frigoris TaxID=2571272 RepID=A0A4U1CPS3_9SPHI|nr:NERD domain-containing protein [Pedobacter frigoris]TKC07485.1 NERD domain-containing protein [Pedobacter frigoris]
MLDLNVNIWILIIVIALAVIYSVYRRRLKGVIGEKTIAWKLARLPKSKYMVINNLVLEVGDRASQIDHLIVSNFGLFVIETKNLKGWILGYENSEYWTQIIYSRKERFYNPVRQNLGHIRALKANLVGFYKINYIPIVVFTGDTTLKVESDSGVIYSGQLLRTIKAYKEVTLLDIEKEAIFDKIKSLNISRKFKRSDHIRSIRKREYERSRLIDGYLCPNCGGALVIRSGRFGKFKGCNNFPNCKFTTNNR